MTAPHSVPSSIYSRFTVYSVKWWINVAIINVGVAADGLINVDITADNVL